MSAPCLRARCGNVGRYSDGMCGIHAAPEAVRGGEAAVGRRVACRTLGGEMGCCHPGCELRASFDGLCLPHALSLVMSLHSHPGSLASFLDERAEWSVKTFGEGDRLESLLAHIRKELGEIAKDPTDLVEWIDVVLLAMDGAFRVAGANGYDFVSALIAKHKVNVRRAWPPVGSVPPGRPVEHERGPEPGAGPEGK